VPKRSSVVGSGVGAKEPEAAEPIAETSKFKECDPGVSPRRKVCEPELVISQVGLHVVTSDISATASTASSKPVDETAKSPGPIDALIFRVKETVNGKVTLVVLKLNKLAEPSAITKAEEEERNPAPGPAKPDTSAVALPGVDANAALVARAGCKLPPPTGCAPGAEPPVNVVPGEKEILVPGGIGSLTNDIWTEAL